MLNQYHNVYKKVNKKLIKLALGILNGFFEAYSQSFAIFRSFGSPVCQMLRNKKLKQNSPVILNKSEILTTGDSNKTGASNKLEDTDITVYIFLHNERIECREELLTN